MTSTQYMGTSGSGINLSVWPHPPSTDIPMVVHDETDMIPSYYTAHELGIDQSSIEIYKTLTPIMGTHLYHDPRYAPQVLQGKQIKNEWKIKMVHLKAWKRRRDAVMAYYIMWA